MPIEGGTQRFQYQPLDSRTSQIRLIRLQPEVVIDDETYGRDSSIASDELNIELYHVSMDDLPEYTAFSYTWGDASNTVQIQVNGQRLDITVNLAKYLKCSRNYQKEPYSVWADAICINQADVIERNQQVRRMKDIYDKAESVLAWLEPSYHSKLAVQVTRIIWEGFTQSQGLPDNLENIMAKSWQPYAVQVAPQLLGLGKFPFDPHPWTAIATMFSNPWWERTWIIQEATGTQNLYISYGERSSIMSWKQVWMIMSIIRYLATQPEYAATPGRKSMEKVYTTIKSAQELNVIREARRLHADSRRYNVELHTGQNSLLALRCLLPWFRATKATLPHDKIYSLLGVADNVEGTALEPDYSLPFETVFGQVVQSDITKYGNLDILSQSCFPNNTEKNVPSWMPDWRHQDVATHLAMLPDANGVCIYKASARSEANVKFLEGYKSIEAQGFRLTKICRTGDYINHILDFTTTVQHAWEDLLVSLPDPYRTGHSRWDAYRHTLVADCTPIQSSEMYRLLYDRPSMASGPFADPLPYSPLTPAEEESRAAHAMKTMRVLEWRTFGTTEDNHMGLFPVGTEPGDSVCILLGGATPFILKHCGEHSHLVGECYIHGLMDGEAMDLLGQGQVELEDFDIL
ncbi:hypothetical protein MMC19_000652 [Ptychographa xylographoides]|nr:hypothetical protein [Ptychographa xylographoides]